MDVYTTREARSNLYKIVERVNISHEPIYIKGRNNKAVIMSEDDFQNMQETLYLLSVPNMRESIREAMQEDVKTSSSRLDW
jgi:prevent-host-death family protein